MDLKILATVGLMFLFGCSDGTKKELPNVEEPSGSVVPVDKPLTQKPKKEKQKAQLFIKVTGDTPEDIAYDQDELIVENADVIVIELENGSTKPDMLHNIVITKFGKYKDAALAGKKAGATNSYVPPKTDYILAASPLAKPGQKVKMEFPAPPAGKYNFVCTYPLHDAKMHGTLIVQ